MAENASSKQIDLNLEIGYDYTENVDPEKIHSVISKALGSGTNIIGSIGNKQKEILDYDKLRKAEMVEVDANSSAMSYDIQGQSFQKVTEELNTVLNCNSKGITFQNTLKATTNNKMESTDNYEYGIRLFLKKAIGASLKNINDLKPFVQKIALQDITGVTPKYATNDPVVFKALFDTYGTHIITKAIFGCRYQYYYLRESFEQSSDIKTQVDYNLSMNFGNQDLKSLGVSPSAVYGNEYTSAYNSESKKDVVEYTGGGSDSSDFNTWSAGLDFLKPTTIAFVGYIWPESSSTLGLVPIWELIDDPTRRKQMEDAYNQYLEENKAIFKKSKVVIIDAFGRHFGKGASAPDTLQEPDYNNKMRTYHKIPEEIMRHVKGTKKGSFYFYYAKAYSTSGGLSEIKFDNEKNTYGSPWRKRGNNANCGVTGCLDDNTVIIKPTTREEYKSDEEYEKNLISGFGINIEGSKFDSENGIGNYNWVKSGADWYKGLAHDEIRCIYTKDNIKK